VEEAKITLSRTICHVDVFLVTMKLQVKITNTNNTIPFISGSFGTQKMDCGGSMALRERFKHWKINSSRSLSLPSIIFMIIPPLLISDYNSCARWRNIQREKN
jgi:hypothetical protein